MDTMLVSNGTNTTGVNAEKLTHPPWKDLCSNFIWNLEENKSESLQRASWLIGVFSIVGCIFNLFVFIRIISQNVRKSHFSKIYYLSLSVADFVVAAASLGYSFASNGAVDMERETISWYMAMGITWVSIMSSLLHVVAITADRFILTTFPFYYHADRDRKRKKVTIGILCIWLGSIILVSSMKLDWRIAFWCGAVCIPAASIGIFVTYTKIVSISIKNKVTKRTGTIPLTNHGNVVNVQAEDIKQSMNTVLLGLSVTFSYIICNIPLSLAVIRYLRDRTCPDGHKKVILHALLTANTVLDPLLYALTDLVMSFGRRSQNVLITL